MANLFYIWDYDIDDIQFQAMLDGEQTFGRLDADWAAVRLLEYAPYPEIVHRLGFRRLIDTTECNFVGAIFLAGGRRSLINHTCLCNLNLSR